MRKLFFGLAFLGAMAFSNTISIAQTDPGDPGLEGGCYQRMYWCGDKLEAYNCESYQTGTRCTRYYTHCYSC
jgi:hypothetical protein